MQYAWSTVLFIDKYIFQAETVDSETFSLNIAMLHITSGYWQTQPSEFKDNIKLTKW